MTLRMGPRPQETEGEKYAACYATGNSVSRAITLAIGRLIDEQELTWNRATGTLDITPRGQEIAASLNWWWDCRVDGRPVV